MKPCTNTWRGIGTPAASSIAGHSTQWKRLMSLPIRWNALVYSGCDMPAHAAPRARPADVALLGQPPLGVGAVGPAERGQVVEQRVRPHVGDVALAVLDLIGQRDAPLEVRAREALVPQPA